jgi:steroid delta-isomerase-like uncharacterized protein
MRPPAAGASLWSELKWEASMSSTESVIRNEVDAANRHDSAAMAACYASTAAVSDPMYPEPLRGREAIASDLTDMITAFPDFTVNIRETLVNGRSYAVRAVVTGHHGGPLMGPAGHVPATGKPIKIQIAWFGQVDSDGRIVEEQRYYDLAGMMAQLGLME